MSVDCFTKMVFFPGWVDDTLLNCCTADDSLDDPVPDLNDPAVGVVGPNDDDSDNSDDPKSAEGAEVDPPVFYGDHLPMPPVNGDEAVLVTQVAMKVKKIGPPTKKYQALDRKSAKTKKAAAKVKRAAKPLKKNNRESIRGKT